MELLPTMRLPTLPQALERQEGFSFLLGCGSVIYIMTT